MIRAYRLLERLPAVALALLCEHEVAAAAKGHEALVAGAEAQRAALLAAVEAHRGSLHPAMVQPSRCAFLPAARAFTCGGGRHIPTCKHTCFVDHGTAAAHLPGKAAAVGKGHAHAAAHLPPALPFTASVVSPYGLFLPLAHPRPTPCFHAGGTSWRASRRQKPPAPRRTASCWSRTRSGPWPLHAGTRRHCSGGRRRWQHSWRRCVWGGGAGRRYHHMCVPPGVPQMHYTQHATWRVARGRLQGIVAAGRTAREQACKHANMCRRPPAPRPTQPGPARPDPGTPQHPLAIFACCFLPPARPSALDPPPLKHSPPSLPLPRRPALRVVVACAAVGHLCPARGPAGGWGEGWVGWDAGVGGWLAG